MQEGKMIDESGTFRFESDEEALQFLRERSDDVEGVLIPIAEVVSGKSPDGRRSDLRSAGAILTLCSGKKIAIHPEQAVAVLNDGILTRLRIPISMMSFPAGPAASPLANTDPPQG